MHHLLLCAILLEFVEKMDNLKIDGMFPISISQISCVNEESEFGGFSISHHRQEKLEDYQIKINAPDNKEPEHPLQRQSKLPKQLLHQSICHAMQSQPHIEELGCRPLQQNIEHKGKQTGYYINKDTFSEEEILRAFGIIDINKDNAITEDDLVFVLDYLKEEFTMEEVSEMIEMLSADRRSVSFEDFKKLGRGDIVPLAKYNIMGKDMADKGAIIDNIDQLGLIGEDPALLVQALKRQKISHAKYEQMKKGSKTTSTAQKAETILKDKLVSTVPIKSQTELAQRRQLFLPVVVSNIEDIIQNYHEYRDKQISLQKVASILEISTKEARELYPNFNDKNNEVDSLLVIIEAVVNSSVRIDRKIELCLELANGKSAVSMSELVHVLQVVKGKDDSIEKKIKAILLAKNIKEPINKSLAFQIVLEYINKLIGIN